jgi:T5orf172 domain.
MQIYFLQRGEGGPIKIGKSRRVQDRINALQTGVAERLELLAVYDGGSDVERHLHKQLAAHRLSGEWFSPHDEVLRVIESVKQGAFALATLPPPTTTKDEFLDERMVKFLTESFCEAIKAVYGTEPGWARQAARESGVSDVAVRQWVNGPRHPHLSQVINLCRNNTGMKAWFLTAAVACWMARDVGVTENEAYAVALRDPDGVRLAWKVGTVSSEALGLALQKIWNDRLVNEEVAIELADKSIWVF